MIALESHTSLDSQSTYTRLLYWAIWATSRRELVERNDVLSAGINYSELTPERILSIRNDFFPIQIEAVDRAVASLRPEPPLYKLVELYFLSWRTIETIAIAEGMSEFHVEGYLRQAIDKVAHRLPKFDQLACAARSAQRACRC